MTDVNRYKQMQQRPTPSTMPPRANADVSGFKQQISISFNLHKEEERRMNELPHSSNKGSTEMSNKDQLTLFQKLVNAEYLQSVALLRRKTGLESRGKRPASKNTGQHEIVHVDKDRIKRRKLEQAPDQSKTREFLADKEVAELEEMGLEIEKREDDTLLIEYFNLLLKRNGMLIGMRERKESLTRIDMKLLKLILNNFKAHMYILISDWVYQEYNLSLINSIYPTRYENIIEEFSNAIEYKTSDELAKSMEGWYNYIWNLPYFTDRVFHNIYAMCIKEDPKNAIEPFFAVPLQLLKDLITSPGHKEEVKQKALRRLLKLSTYPKGIIKIKAIKILSPELYADVTCKETIAAFALENFENLKDFKGNEDDNTVNSQIGLMIRISAEDPQMLLSGIKKFPVINQNVKGLVLAQYKKMFEKCWNPNKEELKEVFEEVPRESVQIVQMYVEVYKNTSFPGTLKKSLITLAKKLSNYQLLQPLIPQISQIEIDSNKLIESAAIAESSGKLEFINGLVQNMSKSINYCDKFRTILTKLHEFDLPLGKNVVEVIDMCIDRKELFELDDVVLPTLIELTKRSKIPFLLPRTLVKVSIVYPKKITACLNIVKILLEEDIWEKKDIMYGIEQYIKKFEPGVRENIGMFNDKAAAWIMKVITPNKY